MSKAPIIIADQEFKHQKNALAYFKQMLSNYSKNQAIDGHDRLMLMSLLERHPEAAKKIGCGIKRFFKKPTELGTPCFWVERVDGTETDFSYIQAVKAKSKSLYQEFQEACRKAVSAHLEIAKKNFFTEKGDSDGKVACDITGEKVAIYESHLDHKSPFTFQVLVHTFLIANNIEITTEMLLMGQDGTFETEFQDLEMKEKFRQYHAKAAQLRILASKKNLSLAGSQKILKSKNPVILSAIN